MSNCEPNTATTANGQGSLPKKEASVQGSMFISQHLNCHCVRDSLGRLEFLKNKIVIFPAPATVSWHLLPLPLGPCTSYAGESGRALGGLAQQSCSSE